jgi:hypothetical protein
VTNPALQRQSAASSANWRLSSKNAVVLRPI